MMMMVILRVIFFLEGLPEKYDGDSGDDNDDDSDFES